MADGGNLEGQEGAKPFLTDVNRASTVEPSDKGNDEGQRQTSVLDKTVEDLERAVANSGGAPEIDEHEHPLNEQQRLAVVGNIFIRFGRQLAEQTGRDYKTVTLGEVFDFAMPATQQIDPQKQ